MGKNEIQYRNLKMIVLLSFALLSVIWALLPGKIVFGSAPVCIHYKILGLQCPFCGLSRAGYYLLHLNLKEAWLCNPLIFWIGWLYTLEWMTFLNYSRVMKVRKLSWWTALVLVVAVYVPRIFR